MTGTHPAVLTVAEVAAELRLSTWTVRWPLVAGSRSGRGAGVARAYTAPLTGDLSGALLAHRNVRAGAYTPAVQKNTLYYGDNFDVLRRHVKDESVDLVYLDPPFNSNADYNLLFEEHGEKAAAQVQAFTDTWEWNTEARAAYEEVVEMGGKTADTMRAFRTMLGPSDMLAYLSMMAPRLIELRRVLKPTGSLWLHCDPTASHYLKVLADAVFGGANFRNEVIWYYYNKMHDSRKRLIARATDTLLFYVKDVSKPFVFHQLKEMRDSPIKQLARRKFEGRLVNVKDEDGHVVYNVSQDRTIDNVWRIPMLQPAARERLGYQTQKPLALLDRIIETSSNPGDLVLDPFCGCGTTIDAAQHLNRSWIGIDITHVAIGLIKHRLVGRYGADIAETYRTIGEPTTVDDARVLAAEDPFQFQAWALGLVAARVAGSDKKGGDKGIDGRLYFHQGDGETRQIVFSVKAGHLVPNYVRDLRGVIEREKAEIGVLLSFEEPTAGMRSEAAEAGFYDSPWGRHPRIQLRTIRELLDGKGVDYPHVTGSNIILRRAPKAKAAPGTQTALFGGPAPDADDSEDADDE